MMSKKIKVSIDLLKLYNIIINLLLIIIYVIYIYKIKFNIGIIYAK